MLIDPAVKGLRTVSKSRVKLIIDALKKKKISSLV